MAARAFMAIDACGTARIDFLVTESGTFVNEINTLPGSMGFYLWEPVGISFTELLNEVIALGEWRFADKNRNMYVYDAHLFEKTGYGSKL